ncbi:MAG TPA: hybrid sensor histidine kinase/response regulator [Armatimonadota bacterium]|nr:hybrid sensor histidine kinase/response regulator [Armatimonadota bacterium]
MEEVTVLLLSGNAGAYQQVQELLAEAPNPRFTCECTSLPCADTTLPSRGNPDLILLDATARELPLADLLVRVQESYGISVPVVALGAPETESEGIAALEQGIQDYLCLDQLTAPDLARALQHALARAKAVTRQQQALATICHELRNPLAPIRTGVVLLQHVVGDFTAVQDTLTVIERNVRLLVRMTDDLLDISRLSRAKLPLRREPLSLAEVLSMTVQALLPEADRLGITLNLSTPSDLQVRGDADRLQQVFLNLIDNALKFTPPGGTVRVAARRLAAATRARVSVSDTGIGIDPPLRVHLFELFRQGDTPSRRKPGLGIGLALVKSLVEAHGGKVWAESSGAGKGSRFTVELPLYRENSPA